MKHKISITLQSELIEPIQQEAKSRGVPLSHLIEEALEFWRKNKLEKDLIQYYQEMGRLHEDVAKEAETLLSEVWAEEK